MTGTDHPAPAAAGDPTEVFVAERPRLLGLAYRMLGSLADAEDVVQDAWLRWQSAPAGSVDRPAAWLTTVTTRLALDRLRHRRRHEQPGGPTRLPEPLVTGPGPEGLAELADSLTLGFLVMLDRLSPLERAVVVLADAFSVPFGEVAAAVGRSPEACRQIASRARRRMSEAHPPTATPAARQVADRLVVAVALGDMDAVLALLTPDAVLTAEGGAGRRAAVRPVVGPARVGRFLVNLAHRYTGRMDATPATVNGDPGYVVTVDGQLDQVLAVEVAGDHVRAVRIMRNPEKLQRVEHPVLLR